MRDALLNIWKLLTHLIFPRSSELGTLLPPHFIDGGTATARVSAMPYSITSSWYVPQMGSGPRRPALQALLLTTRYIASLTVSRFSLTCPSLLEWFTVLLKQSKVTRSPCFQPHHLLTHQVASPRSYAFLILQDVRFFSPTKLSLFPFTRYGFPPLKLFHLQAEGSGFYVLTPCMTDGSCRAEL